MNTEQALAKIYNSVLQDEGPVEAKQYVAMIISNIIDDLQLEGIPVSAESLQLRLCHKAQFYGNGEQEEVA